MLPSEPLSSKSSGFLLSSSGMRSVIVASLGGAGRARREGPEIDANQPCHGKHAGFPLDFSAAFWKSVDAELD